MSFYLLAVVWLPFPETDGSLCWLLFAVTSLVPSLCCVSEGGLYSTAAGSTTDACSLETTDLTCSELNFPCLSGWGLITFVIPLYGREAEGMGDSLGPLQHLDLASALLHHG